MAKLEEESKRAQEIFESRHEFSQFGKAAGDYATHRQGFPPEFFNRVSAYLSRKAIASGSLLDLGTGTGTVARGFASRGWQVTAIDPSKELLAQAVLLDEKARLSSKIAYLVGTAENTGIAENKSFDVITAGQCWHWFDSEKAFSEIERLLRDDGHLVVCYFDWLPYRGSIAERMEELVVKYNPSWKALGGGTGFYPKYTIAMDALVRKWRQIETWTFDYEAVYTQEAWRGRIRACGGVLSLPEDKKNQFDSEYAKELEQQFGANANLTIMHRVFTLIAQKPKHEK